ncbi:uncharacterized protein isoform X3 [Musca autumnalis]|uniref:uncharacterized protein isoform X3 n=1 Tax=Musca autumnalis TaxID=221902 RepID=UPI003CF64D07
MALQNASVQNDLDAVMCDGMSEKRTERDNGECDEATCSGVSASTKNVMENPFKKRALEVNGVRDKADVVCGKDEACAKGDQEEKKRKFNDEVVLYTADFKEKIKGINSNELKKIVRIDAIGATLYKITFEDMASANKFINNVEIKNRKMRAFIPRNFLETFGILRNVPVSFSEEEILEGAKGGGGVGEKPKEKSRDDVVNEMLTPYTYNSIAKKAKRP